MRPIVYLIPLSLLVGCGHPDLKGATVVLSPSENDTENVKEALIGAKEGDVIGFKPGTFKFTDQLSLLVDNVTLKGTAETVFDFKGQTGANGLLVSGNNVTLQRLVFRDTAGDGIRAEAVTDITFTEVEVTWTAKLSDENGAYGIYPVLSERVTVESCKASNARDAGIYVGQSSSIIVRDSEAWGNVAGIEIENSYDAEVFGNHAHDNTGGLLVFALPGLQQKRSDRARVHGNVIENNDIENFAAPGNIVGLVPPGTGVLVFGSDNNEFFNNTIRGNDSFGFGIVNFNISGQSYDDPEYDPFPEGNYIHDNTFSDNGQTPSALAETMVQENPIGDVAWDGTVDANKDNSSGQLNNCFKDNGMVSYVNFAFGKANTERVYDIAEVTCEGQTVPEVSF